MLGRLTDKIKALFYSRILFWLVLLFAAGIAAGFLFSIGLKAAIIIFVVSLFLLIPAFGEKLYWLIVFMAMSAGILTASLHSTAYQTFPIESGERIGIAGYVSHKELSAQNDENGVFYLRPYDIDGLKYDFGEVKIFCPVGQLPSLGDEVLVHGDVMAAEKKANRGSFDYDEYLKRNSITASVSASYGGSISIIAENENKFYDILDSLRGKLNMQINRLDDEAAGLVRGIFLGDKSDLSFGDKENLIQSGILHAFAVSGMHVGYVLSFSALLFFFLRRHKLLYFICNAILLIAYGFVMNFTPSVSRAVIMALIALAAILFDEKKDSLTAWATAALLCLLYRPLWLFDAGFQLSFITVFFIIYLGDSLQELFSSTGRFAGVISLAISSGMAAVPLTAYYFYMISPLGFVLSPVAVLLVGVCVVWGICALLLVGFFPAGAYIFAYGAGALLKLLTFATEKLTEIWGSFFIIGSPKLIWVLLFYVLLLLLPLCRKYLGRIAAVVLCLIMLIGFPFTAALNNNSASSLAGEVMEVSFIDVGQGDCTLIIAPDGKTVLIDGGGEGSSGSVGEYVLIPYLKSRGIDKIDLMINTHPDFDHTDGLVSVLDYFPVGYCMVTGARDVDNERLEKAAQKNDTVMLYGTSGEKITISEGIEIDILFPTADFYGSNENEASIICLLTYGEHSFMFTGDTEDEGIDFIIDSGLRVDVLKVPHHGSYYNFDELMYETLQPDYAVISCGANNSYGHPHREVREYLADNRIKTYRTDLHGEISFFSNGRTMQVITNK